MIHLDTLRALHEHDHELAAYCAACERWAVLDLPALIAQGHGDLYIIGWRPRCKDCGARGELQLRPPGDAARTGWHRVHCTMDSPK